MKTIKALCVISLLLISAGLRAEANVHLLPMNCAELLPDEGPFISFFSSVAKGGARTQKTLSKRMLRILAFRDRMARENNWSNGQNPIDTLIRKTLCFYRQQKAPLKQVAYDSPEFIKYLKTAIRPLENKVEDAIFLVEYEKEQRRQYDSQIEKNRGVIRTMEREASRKAKDEYSKISKNAKKKARNQ